MNGPRVTVRVTQLVRSISTSPATATPKTANLGTIITSSTAAVPLSRKYADLLRERNIEWDSTHHPRSITTRSSNRPHPAPQTLRIMQTFSTTAPTAASIRASPGLHHIVLPGASAFDSAAASRDPYASVRVPLLPDSAFASPHSPEVADGPLPAPQISVVAANPDLVLPVAALTEVEGFNLDGIELKFAHDPTGSQSAQSYSSASEEPESGGGMLRDIWKGLVNDLSKDTTTKAGGGKLNA